MASNSKLARPYAQAAFEYALAQQQLDHWSKRLAMLADWVKQPEINSLLHNPKYTAQQLSELLLALGKDALDEPIQNFLKLLGVRRRLLLLPEVAKLFKEYCLAQQATLDVHVTSALPLTEEYRTKLIAALKTRFNCNVVLHYALDEDLLGGLLIRAGDQVIDTSVRGQLAKMREALTH